MLWVNLIMDTFAALALATEPPAHDILTRMPYHKDAAIVTPLMWRNVFGHSIYQSIVLILVIFLGTNGSLAFQYDIRCLNENADGECLEFNPFFTESVYMEEKEVNYWKESALTADRFNADLLKEFVCFYATEKGDVIPELCDQEYADDHPLLP